MSWSEAEKRQIAKWVREGLSSGEIVPLASEMRRETVTRNAIVGLVNRMRRSNGVDLRLHGGEGRPRKAKEPQAGEKAKPPQPRVPPKLNGAPVDKVPLPVRPLSARDYDAKSRRLPLVELGLGDCRWPVNDAGPGETHLFCGRPSAPGQSYCAHHVERSRGPGTRSEREATRNVRTALKIGG